MTQDMQIGSDFASLGLREPLLASLAELGYEEPTPIQRSAIPPLLEGRDLLGQAATGTGKTAAFTLPLLSRVARDGRTRALVLVPTRELAMQVAEAVGRYGRGLGVSVLPIYGGASMVTQVKALQRGVTVVVATPGRALDHLRRKTLVLEHLEMLILDEADEMLDMGFAEDLEAILTATPASRQTALFSATLPPRIQGIAGRHLRDPVRITIAREVVAAGELPRVKQVAYVVIRAYKTAALVRVLQMESPPAAIVFCRMRTEVDEITEALKARGFRAEALHGGLSQDQRDRVMKRFRGGAIELLIATDVAARGLDIEHVSHVINYDVPSAPESYVHRIGRTGRAGREGVAITITEPREQRLLHNIESLTRHKIKVLPVPTIAELAAKRVEQLAASVRQTLEAGDLAPARAVVESLAREFSAEDVAAAAIKMLQAARGVGAQEEIEIPAPRPSTPKPEGWKQTKAAAAKPHAAQPTPHAPAKPHAPPKPHAPAKPHNVAVRPIHGKRKPEQPTARLWVGAGSDASIRPADLVGAITNEANVPSRVIGAIQISERYSLVEVPEEIADRVVAALRATKLKGRKVVVRRDRALPR